MSEDQILTVIAAFAFVYSLVASKLEKTPVNGALVYVFAGVLFGPSVLDLVGLPAEDKTIQRFAEIALAICLFTDSSKANLHVLRRVESFPFRLLTVGLPLTILTGFGVAWLMLENLSLIELALIATILAPTDAALGKAVVSNPAVPAEIRESLNVESGLNDGICVPIILFFLALATGNITTSDSATLLFQLPVQVIGIGVIVGVTLAVLGGYLLKASAARGWVAGTWLQIPIIALALFCFGLAQWLGGSGFIAAFVGGLIFGALTTDHKERFLDSAEGSADAVALVTWFIFGTIILEMLLSGFSWQVFLYALLSLTVVRMLPVFLCMLGTKVHPDSVLFLGWFGPRGLASIVFLVMVIGTNLPGNDQLESVVSWTIVLSVVLHGLTANPFSKIYGARVAARNDEL